MNSPQPLFNGRGLRLRQASAAGVVADPEVTDIPTAGYSELFNPGGCSDTIIELDVNGGNAAGDVVVEKGDDSSFTNKIDYDTIAVNGFRTAMWNNGGPISGPFRLKNNTGQSIKVWLQQRVP